VIRRRPKSGLGAAGVGATVRLTDVEVQGAVRLRLAEFGLRPGAVATVLARTAGDGRLVALGTTRVVLDRSTASRLAVEPA